MSSICFWAGNFLRRKEEHGAGGMEQGGRGE